MAMPAKQSMDDNIGVLTARSGHDKAAFRVSVALISKKWESRGVLLGARGCVTGSAVTAEAMIE